MFTLSNLNRTGLEYTQFVYMGPRRVLFVTYYFPPAGGPGVQRALKFAKYLPQYGWEPTVLTVRPGAAAYPGLDASLEEEVSPSLRVERTRSWDPYALYARLLGEKREATVTVGRPAEVGDAWQERLSLWLRANLFLPDARVGWLPFAAARARRILQETPHDAIYTTGPPHSSHLIGWVLSRWTGLPWAADFRDPWTGINYYEAMPMSAPARRLDAALERGVIRAADRVCAVTPSLQRELESIGQRPVDLVYNGYDPADFDDAEVERSDNFQIAYLGTLNRAGNPEVLWQALERLDASSHMPDLRLRFVGRIDPVVIESARRHGLDHLVEVNDYVSHDEAVRLMQRSDLLLLVINDMPGARGIMTGKLYEYMASGRPVLGVGVDDGDTAAVLRETGAGRMFNHGDLDGVSAFVERHYHAWKEGRPLHGADEAEAGRFSRKMQAGQLGALMEEAAGSAGQ